MNKEESLINRLIANIQADYVSLAGIDKIEEYRFVPVNFINGYLFIIIDVETSINKGLIANYMKNILPYPIKYINIPTSDFTKILNFIIENKTKYSIDIKASQIIDNENRRLAKHYLFMYLQVSIVLLAFPPVCRKLTYGGVSREDFPHNFSFLLSIPNHYSIDLPVLLIELLILVAVIGMCYLSRCKKL